MPRSLLALSTALVLGAVLSARPGLAQQNVLVIVADDLGVDAVGAYGEGANPPPTPNLDGLAANGVLFRNAWTNAVCSTTRACIQTGRYALRTRVGYIIVPSLPLPLAEYTIPEVLDLGGAAHAAGAFGKWHLGFPFDPDHPNESGWPYYAGLVQGSTPDYYFWPRTVNGATGACSVYATTQFVDDAIAWIGAQTEPWVCYLAFNAPHTPFHAPPPSLHSQDLDGLSPATTPIPFFKAMVEAMDAEIGRLLAALGPEAANTNVIFLGDNGTDRPVTEPPFIPVHAKASPYEGGVNVPLIVSGPAVNSPGREVAALVGAVDVFSTVCEMAGVDARSVVPSHVELDGVSFLPYLANPAQSPIRTTVFAEQFLGNSFESLEQTGFATIRDARYKLIQHFGPGGLEFFDLQADPFEQVNLVGNMPSGEAQAAFAALVAELGRTRSPSGGFSTYGDTTCVGSSGNPTIGATGDPRTDETYFVTLENAPPLVPATLFIGFSDTVGGGLSLPFDLALIGGGTGCRLWASPDIAVGAATTGSGQIVEPILLPAAPFWVGLVLYHSWIVADLAAPQNVLGVTASNGLSVSIGS